MRILGVIPARGGSKGIPRKNIRRVAGEPLIAYTIRAAQQSRALTTFLTSTDDEEIAEIARSYGSPVVSRPRELAYDTTPTVPVVLHALDCAERESGSPFDVIVLLQPTAPLRTGEDIDSVVSMFATDCELECVVSVCPMDDMHPARMYRVDEEGWMESLWENFETARRQDVPVIYYRNGALYAVRRPLLVGQQTLMGKRKKAFVMPRKHLLNIDDERDLLIADVLVSSWKKEMDEINSGSSGNIGGTDGH